MVSAADARLRLEPETTAAGRARRFVEQLLLDTDRDHLVDSAALLTSELVTNAVLHGQGSEIGVSVHVGDSVRIEVHDNGPGVPLLKRYEHDAATGRGLRLVDALAEVWGVEEIGTGKTVWFELVTSPDAAGVDVVIDLDEWPDLDDFDDRSAGPDPGTPLVEIRILAMPLNLYRRASQHQDELRREFALISAREPEAGHTLPVRLLRLVEELNERFGAFTAPVQAELAEAMERGDESVDLVYRLPAEVGPACIHFGALLDEADAYCREGDTLLTLATPPDAQALRRWFLGQFPAQIAGAAPTPWPDYPG